MSSVTSSRVPSTRRSAPTASSQAANSRLVEGVGVGRLDEDLEGLPVVIDQRIVHQLPVLALGVGELRLRVGGREEPPHHRIA